ncbi:putative abieta-7,13-dien-18-ol hydroxylase [Rosa chinensis]|uniref:Putative abieta-7,13-dien-18-ol hydroxylase n=1 Tax=Rosa chinensis TaxID=74649 RepID=A0A2P6RXU5_ROSCH|nr:putative abieta-7,13-dien-18-ol hydroxylase [Rosa chinensis]
MYWRYADPFWKLKRFLSIGSEATLKKNVRVIDDFVYQLIRSKRKLMTGENYVNEKEDLLSRFLMESGKEPEEMTDKYLRDITLNFMFAGKDSSGTTLSWYAMDGRAAETDDILPDGYRVRKGDGVFYMAYAMGRMPYIWGEDAEDFRPERWLKDGIFQPESSFKFVSFHAGPRICIGKDFAYRQMKILSGELR